MVTWMLIDACNPTLCPVWGPLITDSSFKAAATAGPDYAYAAQPDGPGVRDDIYTAPVATAKPAAGDGVVDDLYATPAVTTTAGAKFFRDRNKSVHVAMNRASDLYMDDADVAAAQGADGGGGGDGDGDGEVDARDLYAEQDANYANPDDMLNMFEGDSEADVRQLRHHF